MKTILIVDDDPDMRLAMNLRLRANGYKTAFAGDAISAISEARKEPPDLVILDIGLPGGDGFVVMDRFAANVKLSPVPIIVITARDAGSNKQRSIQKGAVAFFQKPIENSKLLAAIAQALGQPIPG